jgi:hypothetical protein
LAGPLFNGGPPGSRRRNVKRLVVPRFSNSYNPAEQRDGLVQVVRFAGRPGIQPVIRAPNFVDPRISLRRRTVDAGHERTLQAVRVRGVGHIEWRWQIIFPLILRDPVGLYQIKKGAQVRLRPLASGETGFEACDIEPYQEHVPATLGLTYRPSVGLAPAC